MIKILIVRESSVEIGSYAGTESETLKAGLLALLRDGADFALDVSEATAAERENLRESMVASACMWARCKGAPITLEGREYNDLGELTDHIRRGGIIVDVACGLESNPLRLKVVARLN